MKTPSKIDPFEEKDQTVKISKPLSGRIEFKNVWFRYPSSQQQWVFRDLILTIEPNEKIAVMGESGAGKSTMINLLMRFYDPQFGLILVDGIDIRNYDLQELRMQMGLVMQEPTLFNYTIRENILYGKMKAPNE